MEYPKISIVTPSYNQGQYLEETIISILGQNYPNLEYIIIDGGSTDNSIEIIKKYENQLFYWVSETDSGLYDAIQKGFKLSTGDIMAWLNSDDIYHHKCLFSVAELFRQFPQVNWIMGKNSFYEENGFPIILFEDIYHERWSLLRMLISKTHFMQQESIFWKRKLWDKAGGKINVDLKLAGDTELWLRFFKYDKLYSTNLLLSGFRFRNTNQKSFNNIEEYYIEVNQLLHEYKKCYKWNIIAIQVIQSILFIIPVKRYRNIIMHKLLKFTPIITHIPRKGLVLNKDYNLS